MIYLTKKRKGIIDQGPHYWIKTDVEDNNLLPGLLLRVGNKKKYFSYFSTKTYVVIAWPTLVNVYVDLLVFTRIAGTS